MSKNQTVWAPQLPRLRLQGAAPQNNLSASLAFPSLLGDQLPSMAEGKKIYNSTLGHGLALGAYGWSPPLMVGLEEPGRDSFLPACHRDGKRMMTHPSQADRRMRWGQEDAKETSPSWAWLLTQQ